MAILREMAVCALQPFFGMNIHHMHRLAGIYPRFNKFALTLFAPFFRIVRRHYLAICIKQIALAVTLEDAAEIPAMAVIVGELCILQVGIEVIHITQEIKIRPFALGRSCLGIAVENFELFCGCRIFLLLRPHRRRVGFVIPHRVAEIAVQEDIRLMHVAIHALRCWDGAGEYMTQGVPLFLDRSFIMAGLFHSAMAFVIMISRLHLIGNGRINRLCLSIPAIL